MAKKYDVIVVGAGPGGYVAAIRAAQAGMSVALIEKNKNLGGTCARVGCIPSKALLHSTELFYELKKNGATHGITASDLQMDVGVLLKQKDAVVTKLTSGVKTLMQHNKVEVYHGTGWILDAHTLEVRDGKKKETIGCKKLVLALGSEVQDIGSIPFDGTHIVSSDQAISFEKVPEDLLIVGAGAIGLELGSVWSRLGASVTILEGMADVLPGWDKELARNARKEFEKQGIKFVLNAKITKATVKNKKVEVHAEGNDEVFRGDKLLIAVGRRPTLTGCNLEALQLKRTENKRSIAVDENYETSVKDVYAIGDIVSGPMLAHKASEEASILIERMQGIPARLRYDVIPNIVYTTPELASVGKTEEALKAEGIEYAKSKSLMIANGRSISMHNTAGFVKVLADKKTDRILGVHMIGPQASHLIAEAVVSMEFDGSSEDIARSIHAHPTLTETIKEAAMGITGKKIHS